LDPRELVDEAFLRRIRHKIKVGPPTREVYNEIFRICCEQRKIPFDARAVEYLFTNYYDLGKPPRSSDPRDLLEIALSICRFREQEVSLNPELLAEATDRFFCQV
jgi:SpoVK/Ycf46/Vps4 family AAA+-type ATPase